MGRRTGRPWERTLLCVIKALQGLHILVDLQNDVYIRGVLDDCDDAMNVTIKDARMEDVEEEITHFSFVLPARFSQVKCVSLQGNEKKLPLIFIRGSNIRFVHIPDSVNVSDAVEEMRLLQDKVALTYTSGKGGPPAKPGESSNAGGAEV